MSDVLPLSGISGLSFDSSFLSPLWFFCLVHSPDFFSSENSQTFFVKSEAFLYVLLQLGDVKMQ